MEQKKYLLSCTTVVALILFSILSFGAVTTEERGALIALYESTDGDNWSKIDGWKAQPLGQDGFAKSGNESSWYGIGVNNDDQVTKIDLNNNNLKGTIPYQLGDFTNLKDLRLYDNQITGEIPPELGNLTNLRFLFLYNTQLTGNIPYQLARTFHENHY